MSLPTETQDDSVEATTRGRTSAAVGRAVPSARPSETRPQCAWVATAATAPLAVESVEFPALGGEEVEVAVEYSGLCHSDLSVLKNEWGITRYPAILGHEITGRVSALGPNAKGLSIGQRVGVGWNSGSCMHCPQCLSGNQHLCPQVQPTILGHRGGFASHVRAHWAWAIPLPDSLDMAEAGPLLCGGITVFAPLARFAKPSQRVGILGIGGLGHLGLKFAAAFGCEVTAFTSSESKFAEAKSFGAHAVVSTNDTAALDKLSGSLDLLISTVNVKLDWNRMLGTLAPNGRLHVVGAVPEPMAIGAFSLIFQQRSVSGSPTGSPVAIRTMLDFAARHQVLPQNEHYPMSRINEAFARLESGKARYRIVLAADF